MKTSLSINIRKEGERRLKGVAEELNEIIRQTQNQIQKNNPAIWNGYLHNWDNNDWEIVIEYLQHIYQTNPWAFQGNNRTAVETAMITLNKNSKLSDPHPRVLDTKPEKETAWRLLMSMREIYNKLNNIDLPNSAPVRKTLAQQIKQKVQKPSPIAAFESNFTFED